MTMDTNTTFSMENNAIDSNAPDLDRDIIHLHRKVVESHLGLNLFKYVIPIIVILGILGNIMSFAVFSTRAMNESVSSIFFRVLAIADTLVLFTFLPW